MSYLIPSDFDRLIQEVSLSQIISGNSMLRSLAEDAAIEEAKSYLRAKYDVASEFTNTSLYSPVAATYAAANRVYLDAPFYNDKKLYNINSLVLNTGKIYVCTTPVTVIEDFDPAKWTELGPRYSIFYAVYPKPLFNLLSTYVKDDEVYWNGKVYTCLIPTAIQSHDQVIQYPSISSIPFNNVFPDNPTSGAKYWGAGVAYTIPAGSLLNTTYFKLGDNRNQQIVLYILDMLIYHLYRRIPPAVVPEIRVLAYQTAISWFNKVAKGDDIIADIVKIQPPNGGRIRYGSRPKQENHY